MPRMRWHYTYTYTPPSSAPSAPRCFYTMGRPPL